jgi:glycosyltransferase involved in cell wall biosynthesis
LDVRLLTKDHGNPDTVVLPDADVETIFAPWTPPLISAYRFQKTAQHLIQEHHIDVLHDHGVWLPSNLASARAARKQKTPFVLTPRGMLEPWALGFNQWKKTAAWYAYQRWVLAQADLLHATAPAEAANLRNLGIETPIVVAPNGVPIPDVYKTEPSPGAKRTALFLSRVHPKKGLLHLVDAWAKVQPEGWRLVIAGPDELGHTDEVRARTREHGLLDVVSFPGTIPNDEKWAHYRKADLFVLPTFSENFGVVIAEALASGIPAITTTGAPWEDLTTHECGWWIETGTAPLVTALESAVSLSDAERLRMGQRGRQLVMEKYTWDAVAQTLHDAYRWLVSPTSETASVLWNESSSDVRTAS